MHFGEAKHARTHLHFARASLICRIRCSCLTPFRSFSFSCRVSLAPCDRTLMRLNLVLNACGGRKSEAIYALKQQNKKQNKQQ